MGRLTRDGTAEPVSRDQILRRERGQGNIIFPVQLITSTIGNLTRLILTLAICHDYTYIKKQQQQYSFVYNKHSCLTAVEVLVQYQSPGWVTTQTIRLEIYIIAHSSWVIER